jgi:glycosyltransferase involved in cell wall biosynthesis
MTDPHTPLFSVIMVCLNAEEHIAEALGSVLAQEGADFELIVVDGGSTDRTLEIVARHEALAEGRLRLHSGPDEGLYDAMNKGLRLARGEYIVYLGADDRMSPDALSVVAAAVERHDRPEIICGATEVVGAVRPWREPARSYRSERGLPKRAPARHQSIFVSADTLRAVGGFDTRYRIAADYDAYLKAVALGAREILVEQTLSDFRLGGVSSSDARATAREYRDVRVAHGANRTRQQIAMVRSLLATWLVGHSRGVASARRNSR